MIFVKGFDSRFCLLESLQVQTLRLKYIMTSYTSRSIYWASGTEKSFSGFCLFYSPEPDFLINGTEAIGRGFVCPVLCASAAGENIRITSRWPSGNVYVLEGTGIFL